MANTLPRGASQDWLARASTKLQKSIFRSVDHKYRSKIKHLYDLIQALEDNATKLDNELNRKDERIKELEGKLVPFENPDVTVKNVEKEVFRVIPIFEKNAKERKRKSEEVNELSEILNLKNAPASKILKIGPAPRSIFPPPVILKKNELKRNRDRSNSPSPSKKKNSTKGFET